MGKLVLHANCHRPATAAVGTKLSAIVTIRTRTRGSRAHSLTNHYVGLSSSIGQGAHSHSFLTQTGA